MGLKNMLTGMLNSVNQGGLPFQAGFFPETGRGNAGTWTAGGGEVKTWGPNFFEVPRGEGFFPSFPQALTGAGEVNVVTSITGRGANRIATLTPMDAIKGYRAAGPWSYFMPAFGIGFTGYYAYQGYQGNVTPNSGFRGAFDAVVQDLAANTAYWQHGYKREAMYAQTAKGKSLGLGTFAQGRTLFGSHLLSGLTILPGAFMGAAMGQSVAGVPGAFAGAWAGGRMMRNPLALLAIGGAYVVGRGAYDILKTGYRKAQTMKGMDTAGDTAAFFTRNVTTMRGRAVDAIQKSHLNARSALGQEATYMHMTRRDYFSKYR